MGKNLTSTKSPDIEQPVEISLAQAYTGVERSLQVDCRRPCSFCRGNGEVLTIACPICHSQRFATEKKTLSVAIPEIGRAHV